MQTFLPLASYEGTAKVLDYKRLGKQRVESWQILQAIEKRKQGIKVGAWLNHPCVLMWEQAEIQLIQYSIAICKEWIARGYKDSMLERFEAKLEHYQSLDFADVLPCFLGNDDFHQSHRSNLLKKDFPYYSQFFTDPIDLPYVWLIDNKE
jgi:hypothetical protein